MSNGRLSLLIAACDLTLADIYARKFEREGWEVITVPSLAEAEHRAVQMRPSVMIVDGSCTLDMAKEIRRLKVLPTLMRTKIVVLSDGAHHGQIQDALAAGAADYLLAGHFSPSEAVEKMKRVLAV